MRFVRALISTSTPNTSSILLAFVVLPLASSEPLIDWNTLSQITTEIFTQTLQNRGLSFYYFQSKENVDNLINTPTIRRRYFCLERKIQCLWRLSRSTNFTSQQQWLWNPTHSSHVLFGFRKKIGLVEPVPSRVEGWPVVIPSIFFFFSLQELKPYWTNPCKICSFTS